MKAWLVLAFMAALMAGGCSRSAGPLPNEALLFCGHGEAANTLPGNWAAREQLVASYPVTRTQHYPPRGGEGGPTLTAHRLPADSTLLDQPVTMFVRLFAFNAYESEIVFRAGGKSVLSALRRRGIAMVPDHTGQSPAQFLTSTAELDAQQSEEASEGFKQVWSQPELVDPSPRLKLYDFGPHLAILRCG